MPARDDRDLSSILLACGCGWSSQSALAIDVDWGGHLDLAISSLGNGTVTILLGRGDGGYDQRLSVSTGPLVGGAWTRGDRVLGVVIRGLESDWLFGA